MFSFFLDYLPNHLHKTILSTYNLCYFFFDDNLSAFTIVVFVPLLREDNIVLSLLKYESTKIINIKIARAKNHLFTLKYTKSTIITISASIKNNKVGDFIIQYIIL